MAGRKRKIKVECETEEDVEDEDEFGLAPQKKKKSKRKRATTGERQKSTRTEEQKRKRRECYQKWAAKETPEEREERLRKGRESFAARQADDEYRKQLLEKKRNYRKKVKTEKPEKYEEIKKKKKPKQREYYLKRLAEETPEEREERLRKARERIAAAKQADEEYRKLVLERNRNYRKKVKTEMPEKYEEIKKKKRFQYIEKIAMMSEEELKTKKMNRYLSWRAWYSKNNRWQDLPEEEKDRRRELIKGWRQNLSGEKRKRHYDNVKKAVKKRYDKLQREEPEKWAEILEERKAYQRRRTAHETPEQREKRLFKDKVNTAKRKLRQQLEQMGVERAVVELRLEELKIKMWTDRGWEVPSGKQGNFKKTKEEVKPVVESKPKHEDVEMELENYQEDTMEESSSPMPYCDSLPPSPPSSPPPSPPRYPVSLSSTPTQYQSYFKREVQFEATPTPSCSSRVYAPETQQVAHNIKSSKPSKKAWKCPKCGAEVQSPLELSQHYKLCDKSMQPPKQLDKNSPRVPNSEGASPRAREKSDYRFVCMRCNPPKNLSEFKTRSGLFYHVKKYHSKEYWPCKSCNILKYSNKALKIHHDLCSLNQTTTKGK